MRNNSSLPVLLECIKANSYRNQQFPRLLRLLFLLCLLPVGTTVYAKDAVNSFANTTSSIGFEVGLGQTLDIPTCPNCESSRRSHRFVSLLVNFEQALGEPDIDKSQGRLFWRIEAGLSTITDDDAAKNNPYLINFSPLILHYRTLSPQRSWNPKGN